MTDSTLLQQLANSRLSTIHDHKKPTLQWHSAGMTHRGQVRPINEDAFLADDALRLWAVADGLGGMKRGDYASRTTVKGLAGFVRKANLADCLQDIEARLLKANDDCRGKFRGQGSGTTIATLLTYGDHCWFLWAGDSRIYRLRGGHLQQMTTDHSVAQDKFGRGELTVEEKEEHPSSHILTRAVGIHRQLKLELAGAKAEPGDRYLLCSDGLYRELDATQLQAILAHQSLQQAVDTLINRALDSGGRDNISAVVVEAKPAS